jgi:hypothetical protein
MELLFLGEETGEKRKINNRSVGGLLRAVFRKKSDLSKFSPILWFAKIPSARNSLIIQPVPPDFEP